MKKSTTTMHTRFIILFFIALLYGQGLVGQSIKRQVISSFGIPHTPVGGDGLTAVSVGQPPNAGTITNNGCTLRQGFIQPSGDLCPITISYDVTEEIIPLCGTYYVFEYTGNLPVGTTVAWNFGPNAFPSIVNGPVTPALAFATAGVNNFTITVSDGTCQKTASSSVTVADPPFSVIADVTNAWCAGDRGSIALVPVGGKAPFNYLWNTASTEQNLDDLLPGVYRYTVTDDGGCVFAQTAEILGSTQPLLIKAEVEDELCRGTLDGSVSINVLNGEAPFTYTWSDGSTGTEIENLAGGMYALTIVDSKGCSLDTIFDVKVFCDLEQDEIVPGIFTPNGDGFNDDWIISNIDRFPNNNVRVYNRWGNLVWDVDGFTSWDGTNNAGEPLQSAAYFYVIMLNDDNDTILSGSVTLIR